MQNDTIPGAYVPSNAPSSLAQTVLSPVQQPSHDGATQVLSGPALDGPAASGGARSTIGRGPGAGAVAETGTGGGR